MKLSLLFLGKTKVAYLATGIDDFAKRLKRYVRLEITTLRAPRAGKKGANAGQMEAEARLLQGAVPANSLVVALDPGGRSCTSEELADQLTAWEMAATKSVTFLIGGPLGLSPDLLQRADLVLSLSPMTFTHDMARLLLLEQLYRAYTIKAGEQYHK